MKSFLTTFLALFFLVSCSKDRNKTTDDYALDGAYKFSGFYAKIYDTVRMGDILVSYEDIVTTSNHLGTLTCTAGTITCKGLVYDYSRVRNVKETNLITGAVVNSSFPTINGQIGYISSTLTRNYTQTVPGSQLMIDDGNYLFSPEYTAQPVDKTYGYSLNNGVLKITYNGYEAPTKMRNICEATFTKQ